MDLKDSAEFFVEENVPKVGAFGLEETREIEAHAEAAGEHHFGERREEAAVGTVVIGEKRTRIGQTAHRHEETGEFGRVFAVRRRVAEALRHLRENRAAETVLPRTEVHENEDRSGIALEFGGERLRDVFDGRGGGNDEAHRGRDGLLFALGFPLGAHRKRILADRNRDA